MIKESEFTINKVIKPQNKMDKKGYQYTLTAQYGAVYKKGYFEPHFTPAEMLQLGVFEGKYINDCKLEFPEEWFLKAKTSLKANPLINCFGIKSRQSLKIWRDNGWLYGVDNRGWFQWYCRYYCGRRDSKIDDIQIKRWRAFKRHYGQVIKNCPLDDGKNGIWCRPKQRQALLQWSYDCFVMGEL